MKVKEGFMVRQLGDQYVVVALGKAQDEFKGIIRLNKTGAYLWEKLVGQETSKDDLVNAILNQYDIDIETAQRDVDHFLMGLVEAHLLEE